jgi:hypothetical protein
MANITDHVGSRHDVVQQRVNSDITRLDLRPQLEGRAPQQEEVAVLTYGLRLRWRCGGEEARRRNGLEQGMQRKQRGRSGDRPDSFLPRTALA